jgi:hypothetical protein
LTQSWADAEFFLGVWLDVTARDLGVGLPCTFYTLAGVKSYD